MVRIGFVINPVAGMGGRVGLKGTDGKVEKALGLGAKPVAPGRALEFLEEFAGLLRGGGGRGAGVADVILAMPSGSMGGEIASTVEDAPWTVEIVGESPASTSGEDTKGACRDFQGLGVNLILFCGGDGTARDVCDAVGKTVPVLGIPSGVKMHSAVFGTDPTSTALTAFEFLRGGKPPAEAEVVDLDEEAYGKGEWRLKVHGLLMVPFDPNFVQSGKEIFESISDDEVKESIAEHVRELSEEEENGTLLLLGPGSTMLAVKRRLGIEGTLLGIDAYVGGSGLAGTDLNEASIKELVAKSRKTMILVSPIGSQGFLLGRGNLQLSPEVVRSVGVKNLLVLSTPSKLMATPRLRVDTGDRTLDGEFIAAKFVWVVVGYRMTRLVRLAPE